ncbi:VanW family protein [Alteribacter populi]|uniref:VanW family protein n=1 Tax=Alteribacter populi TaxID=2011011 RepID=UPI000BBA6620|nr:VanW family protein [Alteribacter populi]
MRLIYLPIILLIFSLININTPDILTVTFEGETIATVNKSEYTDPLFGKTMVDADKYRELVESIDQEVDEDPVNAMIDEHGRVISEHVGYRLDRQAFKESFFNYFYSNGNTEIEAPRLKVYPKVDSELLAHIRVQEIGHYITYFNSNNKERSHNIALATEAINNHVVFPEETFSFNGTVGKRTIKRGYLPAPIIVRGELAEGIGGGICQVSSTLFNAVDHAGLKIVQRYAHSKRVPYVPPGRDATVSWYGPDFIFKNKHNQPVLIRAQIVGGQVIIRIYSSETINYEPRNVPDAPNQVPKEIIVGKLF